MSGDTEPRPAGLTPWQIDPAHTIVELASKYMLFTTVKGRFTNVKGTILVDEENPARSSVEIETDATSVWTGQERRDAHLRSADFLDVEHYPTITFKSTRVEPIGQDRLRVIGDLTIRGTTREVTLDTKVHGRGKNPWGQTMAGFTAETTVNRKDYGLEWNVEIESGWLVGDTVQILLEVVAVKQE